MGGLFRHVRDVARGQCNDGHHVGIYCDSTTGGADASLLLEDTGKFCAGGITTGPIARLPGPGDIAAVRRGLKLANAGAYDVIHGHGAKGGLIARFVGRKLHIPALYSPHGGSLHYNWTSPAGAAFLAGEIGLSRLGSGFVFVCDFERKKFERKIGTAGRPSRVIHNALWPEEFKPVQADSDASDLLFVGEVRHLKGIDILLQALAAAQRQLTLTVVGDGPELEAYRNMARQLSLQDRVRFAGRLPIGEALRRGRIMVVPSRHESFPYVVLEAAAAGVPLIASRVGGIPEIMPDAALFRPGDIPALAGLIVKAVQNFTEAKSAAKTLAATLQARFSAQDMARKITGFYEDLAKTAH